MANESFAQGLLQNLLSQQQPQGLSSQDIMAAMSSRSPMAAVMAASVPQTTQSIGAGVRGMMGGITGQKPYSASEAYNKAMQQLTQQEGFGTTSASLTAMAQAASAVGRTQEAMQLMAQASEMKKAEQLKAQEDNTKLLERGQARLTALTTIEGLIAGSKDQSVQNRLKALLPSISGGAMDTKSGLDLAYKIAGERQPEPEKPTFNYQKVNDTVLVFDENGQNVGSYTASDSENVTEDQNVFLKLTGELARLDGVLDTIDSAKSLADSGWATGRTGALIKLTGPLAAGSDVETLDNYLLTIKANLGFDRLQKMREESKTGGALGQVAVAELEALQASIATLDSRLQPEILKANLDKVVAHYENYKNALLGKTANVDWSNPAYAGFTKVIDGKRVFRDQDGIWWEE